MKTWRKMMVLTAMISIFSVTSVQATALDDLRDTHRHISRLYRDNAGNAAGLVFACIGTAIACCAILPAVPLVVCAEGAPFTTCHNTIEAANCCSDARAVVYRAKHFLKRVEVVYRKAHTEGEAALKGADDILPDLSEIMSGKMSYLEMIDFIHDQNQTGLRTVIASHRLDYSRIYDTPDYLALMKDYLIKELRNRVTQLSVAK